MTEWVDGDDFYVANSNRMGYYRINYDEETWEALGQQLQDNYMVRCKDIVRY